MFATITKKIHQIRQSLNRSEWAIRQLSLSTSEGTAEESGLLLIQIDGLARAELEAAMATGRMPFLASLQKQQGYRMNTFYPGLPSSTPAVQAELFYGVRAGVPAFAFQNRVTGEMETMFDPETAKGFETKFESKGEGLLQGGSSWSNIYSGGAAKAECHFCISSLGAEEFFRAGPWRARLFFAVLHFPALITIVTLLALELVLGIADAVAGICRGQRATLELGAVVSRMAVGIAVREAVRIGGKLDVRRGLPIVHCNFVGYDELSHRRGPGSAFAHWSLMGIDRAIADMHRAAHFSRRRDYDVWIFSDHGQDRVRSFETKFPGGIHTIVAKCLASTAVFKPMRALSRPFSRRVYEWEKRKRKIEAQDQDFSLASMGPVAHLYLPHSLNENEKRDLARRLVEVGKIPAVLFLSPEGGVVWNDRQGEVASAGGIEDRLACYPEALRREMVGDLVGLCKNENAGDLVFLGFSGEGECWTFAAERGAHAGLGPQESHGFVLTPAATRLPPGDFVRPSGLREAAMHAIGRRVLKTQARTLEPSLRLKIMTYNVHGCAGMDGRISPRRIARIIATEEPDIVALQELDDCRSRSRCENQAAIIAELIGYHVVYCPTVTNGSERYGHAVLSRWPLETVQVAELPYSPRGFWPERRAALWTRLSVESVPIHIVTTHLGLNANERLQQLAALLGPDWLGPVLEAEPVVLCGDFNFLPRSAAYRLATSKLTDVVTTRGVNTFSSVQPVMRLDHIFVSKHFAAEKAHVVRNALTRTSSDHLPLVVESLVSPDASIRA